MRYFVLVLALLFIPACGSKSPTSPSNDPPSSTQTRVILLEANLDFGAIQVGQSFNATLKIRNTGTAPLTINGMTSPGASTVFTASWTSGVIPAGGFQDVTIRFSPTAPQTYGGTLTVNGDQTSGTNTILISGRGSLDGLPLFSRSGSGATVFDMPTYITRVRVVGRYSGRCENFIVWVGGRLVVNDILGSCSVADSQNYDGTHLLQGTTGVVEVREATAINWTITEIR